MRPSQWPKLWKAPWGDIHHPLPLEKDLSSDQEVSLRPTTLEAEFLQDQNYVSNNHQTIFLLLFEMEAEYICKGYMKMGF